MMAEQVKRKPAQAKLTIEKVSNGYIVLTEPDDDEDITLASAMGYRRPDQAVFISLADVVEFIGEYYQEPTRSIL